MPAHDQLREAFTAKLRAVAKEIRKESRGRHCGDCIHFANICNLWDEPLVRIESSEAVACKRWEKRQK